MRNNQTAACWQRIEYIRLVRNLTQAHPLHIQLTPKRGIFGNK